MEPEAPEYDLLQVNKQLWVGEHGSINPHTGIAADSDGPVAFFYAVTDKQLSVGQRTGVYGQNVETSSALFNGNQIDLYSGGANRGVSVQDGRTIVMDTTADSVGPTAFIAPLAGKSLALSGTLGVKGLNVAKSSAVFNGNQIDLYSGGASSGVSVQDGRTIVTDTTVDSPGPVAYVAPRASKPLVISGTLGVSGPNHVVASAVMSGNQIDLYSGGSEIGVSVQGGKTIVTNCTVDSAGPSAYVAPVAGKNLVMSGALGMSGPNQAGSSAIITGQQFDIYSGGPEIGLSVRDGKTTVTNCTVDSAGPIAFIAPETGKQLVLSESLGVYGQNVATSSVQLSGNSIVMYDGGNHPANMAMVNDTTFVRNAVLTTRPQIVDDMRAFVGTNSQWANPLDLFVGGDVWDFSTLQTYSGVPWINMSYTTNTVNIVQRTISPSIFPATCIAFDAGAAGAVFEIEASSNCILPECSFEIRLSDQSNSNQGTVIARSNVGGSLEGGLCRAKVVYSAFGANYLFVKSIIPFAFAKHGAYLSMRRLAKNGANTEIHEGVYYEFPQGL